MSSNGKGKTYLYRFDVDMELNFVKKLARIDQFPGAVHGDDLGYLFASHLGLCKKPEIDSAEFKIINQMIDLWYNFAATGDPNHDDTEWEPLKSFNDLMCYNIANDGSKMIELPEISRLKMWNRMFDELSNIKNSCAKN
jgi:carboxylesterase type B